MVEIGDVMPCSHCHKPTVYYLFDSRHKIIKFYPEPHLKETELKFATTQMKKIPNKQDSTKYDVLLYCPVCGAQEFTYTRIPLDWECFDTPGSLVCIPLDDLKPWTVLDSREQNEKKE